MRWKRVAAVAAGVGLLTSPMWGPPSLRPLRFFAVRRVEVSGARYLDPGVVVEGMGMRRDASVWDDLDEVEGRLVNVAGIREARISRRLPGTLRVAVVEREPVALADGPAGLVAVDEAGRPLPYDLSSAPVDAPVVPRSDTLLLAALATMRTTDLEFYAGVAAATARGGDVVLEFDAGRVRLDLPVDPAAVRRVATVRRYLSSRGVDWRELDGRFGSWVVVRRARETVAPALAPAVPRRRAPARARGGARA